MTIVERLQQTGIARIGSPRRDFAIARPTAGRSRRASALRARSTNTPHFYMRRFTFPFVAPAATARVITRGGAQSKPNADPRPTHPSPTNTANARMVSARVVREMQHASWMAAQGGNTQAEGKEEDMLFERDRDREPEDRDDMDMDENVTEPRRSSSKTTGNDKRMGRTQSQGQGQGQGQGGQGGQGQGTSRRSGSGTSGQTRKKK